MKYLENMKQPLKSGLENDVIYGRKWYKYLKNNNKLVKYVKKALNKRLRKDGKNLDDFTE